MGHDRAPEVDKHKRQLPGVEGCAWRLVAHWDPAQVTEWLRWEIMAQTDGEVAGKALADVMAAAAVNFVRNTTDVRSAVNGPDGVVSLFIAAFQHRLALTERTKSGVFLPRQGIGS